MKTYRINKRFFVDAKDVKEAYKIYKKEIIKDAKTKDEIIQSKKNYYNDAPARLNSLSIENPQIMKELENIINGIDSEARRQGCGKPSFYEIDYEKYFDNSGTNKLVSKDVFKVQMWCKNKIVKSIPLQPNMRSSDNPLYKQQFDKIKVCPEFTNFLSRMNNTMNTLFSRTISNGASTNKGIKYTKSFSAIRSHGTIDPFINEIGMWIYFTYTVKGTKMTK